MYEVYKETVKSLENGDPCLLVTVIRTKGSTPQKPGAKLLVRHDGSAVGTLGGGCVEGDIWFAAKTLLQSGGKAEVRDYYLNEELAARDGLVCGGTMYFLLDPLHKEPNLLNSIKEIVEAYEGHNPIAVAYLTKANTNNATVIGSQLVIRADGSAVGTLGSPSLDDLVTKRADSLLPYGNYEFIQADKGDEVFVEAFTTPPTLILMGGGHVSLAISNVANILGYPFYVVDDRKEFSNKTRFPDAKDTIVAPYHTGINQVPINTNSYIIVATRGHRYDDGATEAAARSPAGYVGLLGSKRKSLMIFESLFRKGIPEDRIRAIRSPIGLDIGARTPEEIAISIMSEILMVRLGGKGGSMKMEEQLLQKAKDKAGLASVRG